MPTIFQKLNLKDQAEILVLNAPQSFETELATLSGVAIRRELQETPVILFSLAFVTHQSEIESLAAGVAARAVGDAIVWFAYPKGSSKRYRCDFNRDTGWDALLAAGFRPIRQVAIDEDWSALRFRRIEFVQSRHRG